MSATWLRDTGTTNISSLKLKTVAMCMDSRTLEDAPLYEQWLEGGSGSAYRADEYFNRGPEEDHVHSVE